MLLDLCDTIYSYPTSGELKLSKDEALAKALKILNSVDEIKAELCKMYGAPDNDQYFIRLKGYEIKNDTGS